MSRSSSPATPRAPEPFADGEAFAAAFAVSRETVARLRIYEALLRRWQRAVNLVAPATLDTLWQRHFADSAQLLALAPAARHWLDLGSGAGFPGMVIAILLANHNGVMVRLVESNARKCAFLADVAAATGAPVDILCQRAERLPAAGLPPPDVITARALAPLDRLLDLSAPLFGPHTRGLFLKGRQAAVEVEAARRRWRFDAVLHASRTEPDSAVVELTALHPTEAAP